MDVVQPFPLSIAINLFTWNQPLVKPFTAFCIDKKRMEFHSTHFKLGADVVMNGSQTPLRLGKLSINPMELYALSKEFNFVCKHYKDRHKPIFAIQLKHSNKSGDGDNADVAYGVGTFAFSILKVSE